MVQKIESAIQAAEARAGVEFVVVVVRRSAAYAEVPHQIGAVAAALALAAVLYSPWPIHIHAILPDLMVAYCLGLILSRRRSAPHRWFTRAAHRTEAVDAGAKQAFYDHAVGSTRSRNGILIYYSRLERQLRLLPDLAVQSKVPGHKFNEIRWRFEKEATSATLEADLCRIINQLVEAVAAEFPPVAGKGNELADTPSIQPEEP